MRSNSSPPVQYSRNRYMVVPSFRWPKKRTMLAWLSICQSRSKLSITFTATASSVCRFTSSLTLQPRQMDEHREEGRSGGEVYCNCTEEKIQMDGGNYTLTKQLNTSSLLIYQCPEGYYPYPATTRVCQANDSWRPKPKRFLPQRCRVVECPDPTVLEYGTVDPPQERYFVHNETSYECYSGYAMRGSARRTCLPNGKWNGSTPICSRASGANCADPGIPAGASRAGNIFEIDDKVKYSCNSNLILIGSKERVCQESGQWTGREPACYYKHTYDTSLEVSQEFGSAIKGSLTVLESTDDTQEGRKMRMSKDGILDIYIGVDISESIEEEQVKKAINITIKLIEKISTFAVSPNYEIIFFSSEVYEIASILDFVNVTKKVELKTIIEDLKKFEVMGRFNMGGSPGPTLERIKQMVYMNRTSQEYESRKKYLDVYAFAIGGEIFDDELQRLTLGTGGKHYFRMKDNLDLENTFDHMIDEEEVKGLCGLHTVYDPLKVATRRNFPWWVYIHVQRISSSKKCLGSLVTPQFVLTAAHCFRRGDLPEHVTVKINNEVKRIKAFTIHPKYNNSARVDQGVEEFYDYDVALIQLKEDIHISNMSRTICIPCTQETSDALKLPGGSTCKDQEELLFKNHRLNFLHKTGETIVQKEAHAKLGDNRNECIIKALKAPGIKTKDPKVAVTDNFLCTGGLLPYRDNIVCKGREPPRMRTVDVFFFSLTEEQQCCL
ncbi:Complement factor B [Liparis tanakae]|uniref:C3/C5 convertase n=1 Tax=Liparis tanakae TaxID=230148 RepID=A0A4Z2HER9_9TELE|nr:Complement factor B [Liparis tanakae]